MVIKDKLVFEAALDDAALRRVDEIGEADIVVGVPSYRNARTIGSVVRVLAEGLAYHYPGCRAVLVNADGGSSDDTMQIVARTPVGPRVSVLTMLYNGMLGKGSGVRAIFEVASRLRARACVVVEAKVAGITGEWVDRLARPVLEGRYDLVTPVYCRYPRMAALNDLLVYPLTWALYGLNVRQPAGGDFGISGDLARDFAERDVWETDVARFGIDVWLVTLAVNEGLRICQANLGLRTDGLKDPALPMDPRFLQTVGTMFRLVNIYRNVWSGLTSWDTAAPMCGPRSDVDLEPQPRPIAPLWEASRAGYARLGRIWKTVLAQADFDAVLGLLEGPIEEVCFPCDLWARVVYDFCVVYNKGEGDPDKVAQALLPLFYLRTMSHMLEGEGMSARRMETLVDRQARAFIRHRAYLWDRWSSYVPWLDEGTRV